MLKKLLISALIVVVLIATGASAYNLVVTRAAEQETGTTDTAGIAALSAESGKNINSGFGQGFQTDAAPSTQPTQAPEDGLPASPQSGSLWQGNTDSFSGDEMVSGQGNQYGKSQGRGRRWSGGNETVAGQQAFDTQNGFQEWITVQGIVDGYIAPNFTLLTDDGQSIPAQLGNLGYIETLGLNLQDGERVSVMGFYDLNGGFSVGQITLESSGQTFVLRDDLGRPSWAGGSNH